MTAQKSNQKFRELSKKHIPLWTFFLFAGCVVAFTITLIFLTIHNRRTEIQQTMLPEGFETPPVATTALSKKAEQLRIGMTREQAIELLGTPYAAALPQDSGPLTLPNGSFGLELRWKNPGCRDISVMFSENPLLVIGWDDGSGFCTLKDTRSRKHISCEKEDRKNFCKLR